MPSLIRKVVNRTAVIIEDLLERIGDPHGSLVMREALRFARERASELALENVRLRADLDSLHDRVSVISEEIDRQRPVIYRDEMEALRWAADAIEDVDDYYSSTHARTIRNLLLRTEHSKMLAVELTAKIHDIIVGEPGSTRHFDPDIVPDETDLVRDGHHVMVGTGRPLATDFKPSGCTCETKFRTAEDWRDHLPCDGGK